MIGEIQSNLRKTKKNYLVDNISKFFKKMKINAYLKNKNKGAKTIIVKKFHHLPDFKF